MIRRMISRIVDPVVCEALGLCLMVSSGRREEGIFQDKTWGYYARYCQGTKMATAPANKISKQSSLYIIHLASK